MIYAEWTENGQFNQGEFNTWREYFDFFFAPDKTIITVHDNTPTYYQRRKEAVRQEAINWQGDFNNHSYSYEDLMTWQDRFYTLARRYGLLQEFRENGII